MNTTLEPKVLRWARERARISPKDLAKKIGVDSDTVENWEETGDISFSDAEKLAQKTYTPFGFLFLPEPPVEKLPVSDFRRVRITDAIKPPSPELLDVLHHAQRRQKWYREYLISNGENTLNFVGKITLKTPVKDAALDIRRTLKIGSALTIETEKWDEAMRYSIEAIEDAGILVLRAGYAGNYTHRKLSVDEFRGFALCDKYAPLIFINGADAPTAQMFTLVHEVVHIWLGESAVFNLERMYSSHNAIEEYCNRVAAEILVPLDEIKKGWNPSHGIDAIIERLSRKYKVSKIVIARRVRDAGFFTDEKYNSYFAKEMRNAKKSSGGNYYLNEQYQNSRRFSVALIRAARSGGTLYHDAMQLLGIKKDDTFQKYAHSLQLDW